MARLGFKGLVLAMSCNTAAGQLNAPINEYLGICDASAAAPLSADMYVVAGNTVVTCMRAGCTR